MTITLVIPVAIGIVVMDGRQGFAVLFAGIIMPIQIVTTVTHGIFNRGAC